MIAYPASLKAVGGARSGVAPVNLLDVQDVNGNQYFWSDRPIVAPVAIIPPEIFSVPGTAMPWDQTLPGNADFQGVTGKAGTAPVVLASGLAEGQHLTVSASGAITAGPPSSYPALGPGNSGGSLPVSVTAPLQFWSGYKNDDPTALIIFMGAFTDSDGNVVEVLPIGISAALIVPTGATQLQVGINDPNPGDNTGAFAVTLEIEGIAVSTVSSMAYLPWLLEVPSFAFHRSLQTDTGSFIIQNLSGDTLSRDAEKILRASTLEGALFVYRLWQADAEAAWLEVHGTLTLDPADPSRATLKASQLMNPSQDDTPLENYCETCQIDWGGRRCGSTQATECSYSFQTCQVVERIMVVLNDFEKNFGEATANTALKVVNRRRKI